MRLLTYELKKIWQPWIVAAIITLGVLYYYMFPEFYIQYFGYGGDASATFTLAAGWAAKYGPTMEPEERLELNEQLKQEKAVFAEQIQAIPEAVSAGITDFDTFKAFEDKHYQQTEPDGSVDMDTEALIWQIIDNTNYFILQSLSDFMETYDSLADNIPPNLNYDGSSYEKLYEQKMARIENLKSRPAMYGYLPSSVLEATNEYAKCFITWSVLSVILLLSPTLVRDRLHRIRSTQWSSRYGRRILKPQMTAALLSALLLTGLNYLAYALPLLTKQALIFKDFGLFSIIGFAHPWFDWSYGNHLLILSIMSFVLTLAAAGITLFLSQYSGNYVSMLFKALPLFIILELLYTNCFIDRAFMFANPLSERLHLPGAEAICSVMLALISIVLCLLACRKQLKREL